MHFENKLNEPSHTQVYKFKKKTKKTLFNNYLFQEIRKISSSHDNCIQ